MLIAKSIIEKSFSATAWVLGALLQMGEITFEVFLSPNIYADLPPSFYENSPDLKKGKKKPSEPAIRQSLWRLRRAGFVEKRNGKFVLTKSGEKVIKFAISRKQAVSAKWDKKYRLVIFDIPENKNNARDWLRGELYLLEYKKLQKSVFIGKLPLPEDLIKEIKKKKVGNYVNYVLAEKVYKNIF